MTSTYPLYNYSQRAHAAGEADDERDGAHDDEGECRVLREIQFLSGQVTHSPLNE